MEQQFSISTTLDKFTLVHNLPVEFSINNRRNIKFRCPTIKESSTELNLRLFIGALSLTEEQIKEAGIKLLVKPDSYGALGLGLLFDPVYGPLIAQYLVRYVEKAEYKDKTLYIDNEKILSYELNYIIDTIMVALGRKQYEEKEEDEEKIAETNPMMAKILAAQKETEEKLNKIKQKKAKKSGKGYTIEEILLAVSYEFGLSAEYLLNLNYFALIWYFGFVAKVDAHKLNQMILSSGMSKQKSYSYWLNK
jgi:hypothetical protein